MSFGSGDSDCLSIGKEGWTDDPSRFAVRNSKRYKIGEAAELLGITPQSIRYYESLGIIKPEKNPISGYRYYSAWDINMLIRARAYRQQGVAMNEVVDIMTNFNLVHTMNALSHKEGELRQEIADRVKLVMNVRDNYRILQDAASGRNRITFEYRPAMHFLQTQIGYDIIASRKDIIGTWVQRYAAFVLPGGLYKGQGKNDVAYGLFVDDSKLAEVDFKNESEIQALPSQFCLTSSFFSGSNAELKCESFQFAFDYIEEHGLTIVGDPASRIVTMACAGDAGGNVYTSLHKLWIPVSGAEDYALDEEARIDELVDKILGGGGI